MEWLEQDIEDLKLGVAIQLHYKSIAEILNRSYGGVRDKASRLGLLKPKNLSDDEYIRRLPKDISPLEPYIDTETKIIHKHSCGYKWKASPHHILRGTSCPACASSVFKLERPALTYLVYFHALGLYKVGVTGRSIKERFRQEAQPYEVIFYRGFEKGKDAKELEDAWLINLGSRLYNSNELKGGNTETFIYD